MSNNSSYQTGSTSSPNRPQNYNRSDLNWQSLYDKDAKTLDQFDLGKVKQVADEYVHTEKGLLQKDKFFIPRRFADRFDGKTLWFSITKMQAESEFKREIPPGPGEFANKYTTVEKRVTERTIQTLPSGEQRETVQERTM